VINSQIFSNTHSHTCQDLGARACCLFPYTCMLACTCMLSVSLHMYACVHVHVVCFLTHVCLRCMHKGCTFVHKYGMHKYKSMLYIYIYINMYKHMHIHITYHSGLTHMLIWVCTYAYISHTIHACQPCVCKSQTHVWYTSIPFLQTHHVKRTYHSSITNVKRANVCTSHKHMYGIRPYPSYKRTTLNVHTTQA
jgi:hypothetical protein